MPVIVITLMISGMPSGGSKPVSIEASIEPWTFGIVSDTQHPGIWNESLQKYDYVNTSNPIRKGIITSLVENNPEVEFILHAGDMVSIGGEQEVWDRYYEDIAYATQRNIPFYYAMGNHEKYTYPLGLGVWGPDDEDFSTYLANVELPGNERFYSFDFEDQIHFVFINTEEDINNINGNFEISPEQEAWLTNDLETNTINFTVALFHRPIQGWMALGSLLEQYGVDLVISGHHHVYHLTNRNGIMHLITGGGGGPLLTQQNAENSLKLRDDDVIIAGHHYSVGTVIELNGELTIKIDMFGFDMKSTATSLSHTFEITIPFTRPPDASETSEITETSEVSSDLTRTSTQTTNLTSFPVFTVIIGIVPLIIWKKRNK
jgi:predicted phosphodiesterase